MSLTDLCYNHKKKISINLIEMTYTIWFCLHEKITEGSNYYRIKIND